MIKAFDLKVFLKFKLMPAVIIITFSIIFVYSQCPAAKTIALSNGTEEGISYNSKCHFKHSDVIAFGYGTIQDYIDYGVTFVSWGRCPKPGIDSVEKYRKHVRDALLSNIK